MEDTVADLEAATQALRGYVGSIRSVNDRVEATADRALAVASEQSPASGSPDSAASAADAEQPAGRAAAESDPPRADRDDDDTGRGHDPRGPPTRGRAASPDRGDRADAEADGSDERSVADALRDVL
ncbi:DUF7310 family coiled-coil domain-containing protein [Halobaculum litoreum]|uniref:DUF7310 domain-containing protein n=1 Tax=Halobaculum litoreum TaxID=3031998 RepID=A0ABD5XNA1_9EURY|nr:hypothetical protein [Halobaculum sp. DT92]